MLRGGWDSENILLCTHPSPYPIKKKNSWFFHVIIMVPSTICSGSSVIPKGYQRQQWERDYKISFVQIPLNSCLSSFGQLWRLPNLNPSVVEPAWQMCVLRCPSVLISFIAEGRLECLSFTCKNKDPWQNLHFKLPSRVCKRRLCDLL